MSSSLLRQLVVLVFLALLGPGPWARPVRAQEAEPERPWSNTADLAVVLTTGNSEATSLSITDKFVYQWDRSEISLTAFALRSETTERGTPELVDGEVRVPEVEATVEAYSLGTKYRYRLTERLLVYSSGGWERDRRAGIDDRFNGVLGLGYRFLETDRHTLVAEVGGDYTDEDRVGAGGAAYAGVQGSVSYERKLTDHSKLNVDAQVLENLEDTEDLRVNSTAALTASLTEALALKVSYTVKFDNQPVQIVVDPDSGARFTFDQTDTRLGVSLVVNF